MGKVSLEGLEFFAHHGYYDEEQKVGNKYSVDITVETDFDRAAEEDRLSETINYEILYQIVVHEMSVRSRLLENIGRRIIRSIFEKFPQADAVDVCVAKFNPPIGGVCRSAKVSMKRSRNQFQSQPSNPKIDS